MNEFNNQKEIIDSIRALSRYIILLGLLVFLCISLLAFFLLGKPTLSIHYGQSAVNLIPEKSIQNSPTHSLSSLNLWKAPDINSIPKGVLGDKIRYGRDLIAHTARYFGPKGSIAAISNGMNCQNCHLEAGTRIYGNNFASFISSYPKRSNRSGKMSPPSQRIVECMQRSMSGISPDTNSREVRSMLAYLAWIGQGVKKTDKLFGTASEKLPFMEIPANPLKGLLVYKEKCENCHGSQGEGKWSDNLNEYIYPPLWGKNSFNNGAGMYRIINMAGFIKNNMPYGTNYTNPQLSNEEAWNVAAYIESQPRNAFNQSQDWKDLSKKPIDLPFSPYLDTFTEKQHKFGPFKPILEAQTKLISKR